MMNAGVLILMLFALSVATRPMDGLDVCNMKSEEVAVAEVDRYTRIYIPEAMRWMKCAEYLSCSLQEQERISKCNYVKKIGTSDVWGKWNDIRWAHIRVKCERLLGYEPVETESPNTQHMKRCSYCPEPAPEMPPAFGQKIKAVNPYAEGGPCWCEYHAYDTRDWPIRDD